MIWRRSPAVTLIVLAAVGCTVAEPSDVTTTTVGGTGPDPVVLDSRGLLPYEIGQPVEIVVQGLTDLYGGPDHEIPWSAADATTLGDCPGEEIRALGWGSLYVVESREAGSAGFVTWTYGFDHEEAAQGDPRDLGLVTTEGIGLGHTRERLEATYGARVVVEDDPSAGVASFVIDGDRPEHVRGLLTGPRPDDVVTYLERVPGCE